MLYFIINDNGLKIDLSHFRVTFNEANDWFTREFRSDYSFPIKVPVKLFKGFVDFNYNADLPKKKFSGKLFRNGVLVDATLKIDQKLGEFVECIIFSGLEQFPNFAKKLSELPLHYHELDEEETLKQHALETITKNFPETDYNFFMIHSDIYDPTSSEFNGFERILNNFRNGAFVENSLDEETNIDSIKNIMQPLPYLMHVLLKGFEDAGFELQGDILTIPDLQRALITTPADYFLSLTREEIPFRVKIEEWESEAYIFNNITHVLYNKSITIEKKGTYILQGSVFSVRYFRSIIPVSDLWVGLYKNADVLDVFSISGASSSDPWTSTLLNTKNYDIELELEVGDVITVSKIEPRRDISQNPLPDYPEAVSLSLFPVRYKNEDDSPIISLQDLDFIDLKRCVPDMTFEQLVMDVRMAKNLDFVVTGNVVRMDYISPKLNRNNSLNLSKFDIEEPPIKYNDERSYEMLFVDKDRFPDSYDSVFIDRDGFQTEGYKKPSSAEDIRFDWLPLPVLERSGVTTALMDDEKSKLRLAFANAITIIEDSEDPVELPVCFFNNRTTMLAMYQELYKPWINFLLFSRTFDHEFIGNLDELRDLYIKKIVYAFRCHHVISDLEKEFLLIGDQQFWKVVAKLESLPLKSDPL